MYLEDLKTLLELSNFDRAILKLSPCKVVPRYKWTVKHGSGGAFLETEQLCELFHMLYYD